MTLSTQDATTRMLDCAYLPLYRRSTQVAVTAVDQEDYEFLSQWRWYLHLDSGVLYANRRQIDGPRRRTVLLHRVLLGIDGDGQGEQGDHIDGDGLNNQRSNLRKVTPDQNRQNRRSNRGSTSRYRGVYYCSRTKKWGAFAHHAGRDYWLGRFDSEEEAAKRSLDKRLELMPYAVADILR